jgi:hypothetical protein
MEKKGVEEHRTGVWRASCTEWVKVRLPWAAHRVDVYLFQERRHK